MTTPTTPQKNTYHPTYHPPRIDTQPHTPKNPHKHYSITDTYHPYHRSVSPVGPYKGTPDTTRYQTHLRPSQGLAKRAGLAECCQIKWGGFCDLRWLVAEGWTRARSRGLAGRRMATQCRDVIQGSSDLSRKKHGHAKKD